LLDAVVYLNHGHVFVNAMTGNVIFLGIAAIGRNWGEIIPHLFPFEGALGTACIGDYRAARSRKA
jgi:uncharacterized membrane protein YoaK (UPF0700 family)